MHKLNVLVFGPDSFIATLNELKSYLKFNLCKRSSDFDKIVDMVGENKKVHLQISNIWQYEINYLNTPLFEAQENFVKMINELLRNDNVVYFSGDTPGGMFYEYADMRLLPGIV